MMDAQDLDAAIHLLVELSSIAAVKTNLGGAKHAGTKKLMKLRNDIGKIQPQSVEEMK
jgi:hypothetical protein